MDATSRRICLTGVLKMNSFRDSFLFSPFSSPYFLLFGHGCRLLFPRLRRNETTEWTDRYGACKRYRSTLPIPMRKREEIFLNVQRPRSFVSVSRFPPSFSFFFLPFFPQCGKRGAERLERKLKRLRGKMAPRDGNCYSHPLILK